LRLLDHTLDGIVDVVSLFLLFLDGNLNGNAERNEGQVSDQIKNSGLK